MTKSKEEEVQTPTAAETTGTNALRIKWNDSEMTTTYSNVCNAMSSREEFMLLFGTNQTWNLRERGDDINLKLTNRVVVSPFAAKRLAMMLDRVIKEHESRWGDLEVQAPPPDGLESKG
ncbi:MAG: DUF3467 domain-containing protein [Anaerolineales bacterium]|nr:DUF3467 domain-containing protein [Anaerolineales bacterium]